MKKQYIYIFWACLSAVFSCVRVDESLLGGEQEQVEMIELSIDATIEKTMDTKTTLEGSLSDDIMRTVWVPSDSIAVVAWRSAMGNDEQVVEFKTNISENSETASFKGVISASSEYQALYPYDSSVRSSNGRFIFKLPQNQKYVPGSFDPEAAPMVAKAASGESFEFQNLCGLLALQMTGEDAVKAITFIGRDEVGNVMPLSGTAIVNMSYEDEPVMAFSDLDVLATPEFSTSVTLNCETPVQLSETAIPFFFVLPPATYSSFMVMVHTADGKVMVKETTKPITISRSHVKPTAALQYAETVFVDLSEDGLSNSYIVSEPGMYSFDGSIIGNGEFGLVHNSGFHTTDAGISPSYAELLWEDRNGIVAGPVLVNGQVKFYAMGKEGNALIAVKDESGTILWSWHIWVTDQPVDQVYKNNFGTFTVMDRNLGAIRNDRGSSDGDWLDAMGLLYQWGRKDPFTATLVDGTMELKQQLYTVSPSRFSIASSVTNPTVFVGGNNTTWEDRDNSTMWQRSQKTIYDPCPHGYKVISREAWRGFTKDGGNHYEEPDYYNVSGDYDKGWLFKHDGENTTYYPANNYIERNGSYIGGRHYYGDMWSSTSSSSTNAYRLRFYYDNGNSHIEVENGTDRLSYGYPVRCMKDLGVVHSMVTLSEVSNYTSSSVAVSASVSVDGHAEVSRRGFIYSTSAHPNLDNTDPVECGGGVGDFYADLDGLSASTKYYLRAFAVVESEVIYSNEFSFITPDIDGVINLSSAGTANSYIVSHAGTYIFDATVKGNSSESIGTPATVEIVWETLNTSDSVTEGAIISSISLEDGYVMFSTPENFTPGNALIAVRDVTEAIIWSWHIWAVNFDPEGDAQIYKSGAMMMDRNLGALNTIPGDVRSFGLFYQWGRKDPFVGSGDARSNNIKASTYPAEAIRYVEYTDMVNNLDYAILNPNHYIQNSNWNSDGKYWGEYKTKYDPCPPGWRVPDNNSGVWEGFTELGYISNGSFFEAPMSEPVAYYPYSGRMYSLGSIDYVNNGSFVWIAERAGYAFSTGNSWVNLEDWRGYSEGNSVRCMKDADFTLATADVEAVAGIYAVVGGELTVKDATHIDIKGIVYSPISSDPKLATAYVENVADTEEGTFKVTLSDLKPNTTYWYRAYARGGYNTRYGAVKSFTTKSAADNEGFGSVPDEFEW